MDDIKQLSIDCEQAFLAGDLATSDAKLAQIRAAFPQIPYTRDARGRVGWKPTAEQSEQHPEAAPR